MRLQLTFNTKKLIKKVNSAKEFYEVKESENKILAIKKYKNKRGSPFSSILPKEIYISPEAVGLIVGEGFIGKSHFVFANSNKIAIDIILAFLKQFDLPIKFYLEISIKGKSKKFIKECISFWEKHLRIKINRVRLRKEFYNSGNKGTIHIGVYNTLLAKLLKQVIQISKKKIESSRNLSIGYLKGIIAAEGNVNIKKSTKCVYMVRISASKQEERDHYKRDLEKVGINVFCSDMKTITPEEGIKMGWKTTKGRAGAVIISRWDNFVKIFELDLLELNKDKQNKFLYYFINNKFTKEFLDFEYFLNKKFTMEEAQLYFKLKGRYLGRVITLYKKGYISRKKKNNRKRILYHLTKKYTSLYNKFIKEGASYRPTNTPPI